MKLVHLQKMNKQDDEDESRCAKKNDDDDVHRGITWILLGHYRLSPALVRPVDEDTSSPYLSTSPIGSRGWIITWLLLGCYRWSPVLVCLVYGGENQATVVYYWFITD